MRVISSFLLFPVFTTKPALEFRAQAAQLALNKARSLRWIVEAAMASQRPKSVAVSPSISTGISIGRNFLALWLSRATNFAPRCDWMAI
jgi:hypothetical protein